MIAGLGNPGIEYVMTRHNIGFKVADKLVRKLDFSDWKKEKNYFVAVGRLPGVEVVVIKPRTYMNLSGNAVLSAMSRFLIPVDQILVVVDDLALPFGKIRFRSKGSDGGHNGLASIIEKLGRSDFSRLRIGIDKPEEGMDTADYVLSNFSTEEAEKLKDILDVSVEGIESFIQDGISETMNKFNNALPGVEL